MFHLLRKPLTIPSFLLVDMHRIIFFPPRSACCHPPTLRLCLSLIPILCPMLLGEWAHVVPISHVGNSLRLSPSVLSVHPLLSHSEPSCHPQPQFCDGFLSPPLKKLCGSFFMAALKGLLPEENGDEERRAGWFPSATYLRVMCLRKSDPWEFIMRITNPPLSVSCNTSPRGL